MEYSKLPVFHLENSKEDPAQADPRVFVIKKGITCFPRRYLVPDRFHRVTEMDLSGNLLVTLPPELFLYFPNLCALCLNNNQLLKIPQTISLLKNLEYFFASKNLLKQLPPSISRCPSLKRILVSDNPITEQIPYECLTDSAKILHILRSLDQANPATIPEIAPNYAAPQEGHSRLSKEELRDKILGVIFGNAIGDAVGLATEFMTKEQAQQHYQKDVIEFADIVQDRHRHRWARGDWTDDTDQAILILETLLENDMEVDYLEFAHRLQHWVERGFPDVGDYAGFGLGMTVGSVVYHKIFLDDPYRASYLVNEAKKPFAAANGAIMRTSVLGIPYFWDLDKVVENTIKISRVTHYDERCTASAVAVTVTIALILQGKYDLSNPLQYAQLKDEVRSRALPFVGNEEYREEFLQHFDATSFQDLHLHSSAAIGYTYKAMGCAFVQLQSNDFTRTISELVMEAGDADTNGAVCGAVLGCKLGYSQLRPEWRDHLHQKDWLMERANALLQKMGL